MVYIPMDIHHHAQSHANHWSRLEHGLLLNMKHDHLMDIVTTLQTQGTILHIVSPSPFLPLATSITAIEAMFNSASVFKYAYISV